MTAEEELRMFLLEEAVDHAVNTIEFLHGCLTSASYRYDYPEMTLNNIAELRRLVPGRPGCVHGTHKPDCDACQAHAAYYAKRAELMNAVMREAADENLA